MWVEVGGNEWRKGGIASEPLKNFEPQQAGVWGQVPLSFTLVKCWPFIQLFIQQAFIEPHCGPGLKAARERAK